MMLDLYIYNRAVSAWAKCLRFRHGYWKPKETQITGYWPDWLKQVVEQFALRPLTYQFCLEWGEIAWVVEEVNRCRVQLKCDGTRWRTVGEVKGKQASGVGSQYFNILPRNNVYPALGPTMKTYDKLPSSVVSRELSSKIRQLLSTLFPYNTTYCWHSEFSCCQYYDIWYDIFVNCNFVDTRWQ